MKRIALYFLVVILIYSCGSNDQGELVGHKSNNSWHSKKPMGMALIPGGSYIMGKQSEDVAGGLNAPARTVTVRPFYIDETEITNSEYKEFVYWVRDSIVRTELALYADLMADADDELMLEGYRFLASDTTDMTPYQKYMFNTYGGLGDLNSPTQGRMLDWSEELIWDVNEYPSEEYAEVMVDSILTPIEDSFGGTRMVDVSKLKFKYYSFNQEAAARGQGKRRDFVIEEVVQVYPDTTVWIKDFNYSYNDPMHQDYFHHVAYSDYPVVGVTWGQAKGFCKWRTKKKNDFLKTKKNSVRVPEFRLALESEWEFAARGGLENATYPWGNPYTTTDRGCFLANFKPDRGNYAVDGALYTMEAKSYNANDYGLYNMSGNVSEWTISAYDDSAYKTSSTMNPNIELIDNPKKVIRGGSWKDVAYFLEVSTRDYEYADSARSYIGFRTVQDYLGTDINE